MPLRVRITRLLSLSCALTWGCARAGPEAQHSAASAPPPVWVNLRSGVYHCHGTQHYGTTVTGEYLAEAVAQERGFRPPEGRACERMPPTREVALPSSAADSVADLLLQPDSAPLSPPDNTVECSLSRINDGDTIECFELGKVRLLGVDTPEASQSPFGAAATAGMASLVYPGVTLRLELDLEDRDRYGRLLAYVWAGDSMINWYLVRYGWAVSLSYAPNLRYASSFAAAELRASKENRGLWLLNGFSCRPVDHRRSQC